MKTNDLKKNDKVKLRSGWNAIIEDNKKGNIRLAKVFGDYTEIGSVYAWDIVSLVGENCSINIELTPEQIKAQKLTQKMEF